MLCVVDCVPVSWSWLRIPGVLQRLGFTYFVLSLLQTFWVQKEIPLTAVSSSVKSTLFYLVQNEARHLKTFNMCPSDSISVFAGFFSYCVNNCPKIHHIKVKISVIISSSSRLVKFFRQQKLEICSTTALHLMSVFELTLYIKRYLLMQ